MIANDKVKDITSEWHQAEQSCAGEINDSPNDYFCWKSIRQDGYEYVSIDGEVYHYSKHGITDKVDDSGK